VLEVHSKCATSRSKFSLYWIGLYFLPFTGFWITLRLPWNFLLYRIYRIYTQSVPWIHCIECIFFIIQNFDQLALGPKNRLCPIIFPCIEIFFIFQDFWPTCACPEKQSVPWIYFIEYIFLSFRILNNLRLPWNVSLYLIYVLQFRMLSNLCLPWNTECALNSLYWIHIFIIQNFEQLALALTNRVCPEIFHCIEIFFIIQDFWATCACPENRVCPEFFKPGGLPPLRLVRHWMFKAFVTVPTVRNENLWVRI